VKPWPEALYRSGVSLHHTQTEGKGVCPSQIVSQKSQAWGAWVHAQRWWWRWNCKSSLCTFLTFIHNRNSNSVLGPQQKLRGLQTAHWCRTILRWCLLLVHNLKIGTQFPDSKSAISRLHKFLDWAECIRTNWWTIILLVERVKCSNLISVIFTLVCTCSWIPWWASDYFQLFCSISQQGFSVELWASNSKWF